MSEAFGQITFGEKPQQIIKIIIDENGIAHVTHEVEGSVKTTQQVETVVGKMLNFSVVDRDGNDVQHLTLEKDPIAVVLPGPNRDMISVRYDPKHVTFFNDRMWTWRWVGI